MKAVLLALTLLLLAPEALAGGAVWTGKKVVVFDLTSAAWDGVIAQTVADFNAVMPKKAPLLVYQRMAAKDCAAIRGRDHKRGIVTCSTAAFSDVGGAAAGFFDNDLRVKRYVLQFSDPYASANPTQRARAACHELMHAYTGIRDNYHALPDTSCVWGSLTSPGPFDVAYAKRVYGKKGRH